MILNQKKDYLKVFKECLNNDKHILQQFTSKK